MPTALLTNLLPTLLPSLLALPQDPPRTATELLPLQQLCTRERSYGAPPWGSLLRYRQPYDRPANLVLDAGDDASIGADGIADAVHETEQDAIDNGNLFVQAVGSNLLAFGEAAAVRRVRQRVDAAARVLARPVQVEFALWDASDREAPGPALTPDEFARFASNHAPIWRAVGTGRAGNAIALERMRWTRYVHGIEVEVAQKQTMTRPATEQYGEGGHAVVRAYALAGCDDFAVHVQFAVGEKRGVNRTLQTGMPGAADIELPRLESYFGACSARVPNGGALAATMRGNAATGGQRVLTFRVTSRMPPATLDEPGLALVPCGALTTAALTPRAQFPDAREDDGAAFSYDDDGVYGRVPVDQLIELAQGILDETDDGDGSVRVADGYLLVRGSAAAVSRVEALVRGLQDEMVQNVAVRHAATLEPAGTDGASDPARPLLHELTLPTLLGREAVACRLLETNIVKDVFIEVAQEAGSLAPEIEVLQSGAWFRLRAVPAAGSLHVDLEVRCTNAPTPPVRAVMPGGGVLMQAEVDTTRLDHDGVGERGGSIDQGEGPAVVLEDRGFRSTMATTVRR